MRTYTAGIGVTLRVSFEQGGAPQLPDTGSATYTIFGQTGVAVAGQIDQAVSVSVNTGTIEIPDEVNEITSSFEKRTVVVSYLVGGRPYTIRQAYRLVPFLNYTVEPRDVRKHLGVNDSELPDEDIDLVKAFFAIQEAVGSDVLDEALSSGEVAETRANEAILFTAALEIIPSLQLRIAQQQADGPISFQRVAVRDFSKLEADTRARLTTALNVVSGRTQASFPLMITTEDADPITG